MAQADTPHTELSPVSDLASEIGQLGRSKFAQIFFGVTVSRKAGEVTLYTSDATRADDLVTQARSSLVDSESRSIPVEVELVDYTREQLHKARQKLWKLASQWASTEIYTIAVNPDGTGLTATTNNPTSAQALLAETPTALAIPKASVAFEKGHPVVPMTRFDDYRPYAGGAYIYGGGVSCTSGFGVYDNGGEAMVTASHCFDYGVTVRDGGGEVMGTATNSVPYWDAVTIPTDTWSGVYTVDNYWTNYVNWDYSYLGQVVCQSGYPSNRICSIDITNADIEYRLRDGTLVRGVQGRRCVGCVSVRSGDSGGPVWVYASGGVQSRGIVSAGSNPLPGGGFEYVYFTETGDILGALNAVLIAQ